MDQQPYIQPGMPPTPQAFTPPPGMPGAPAANPYAPAPANPNDIYAQFAAQNAQAAQTGGGGTGGGANTGGLPIVYLGGQPKDANTLIVKIGVHPATPAQYWRDLNRHKIWPDFKKKVHCLTHFGQRCPVCEAVDQYIKFLNLPQNMEYQVKKDYKFIMFAQLLWAERPITSGREGGNQRQVQAGETIILMGPSTLRTAIQNTMTTAQAASQVLGPVGLPLKLVFTGQSQSRYMAAVHLTEQPVEFHVRPDLPPLNDLMWPKDLTNEAVVEVQNYAQRLTEAGMRNMAASTGQAPAQMYPPANTAMGLPGVPPGVPPQQFAPQGYPPQGVPQGMPPGVPQQPQYAAPPQPYAPQAYPAAPQGLPPGVPMGAPPAAPPAYAPQPMPQGMPPAPPPMPPAMPQAGYPANPNSGAVGAPAPAAPEAPAHQWPAQAAPTYPPSEMTPPPSPYAGISVLAPAPSMPPAAPPAPPEMPSAPPVAMAAPPVPQAVPAAPQAPAPSSNGPILPDGSPNSEVVGPDGKPLCFSHRPDTPNTKCMICPLEGGDDGCIPATAKRLTGG